MSTEAVQAVLERTVTDPNFRSRLFSHPDEALAEHELTADERGALRETKKVLPFWLTGGL